MTVRTNRILVLGLLLAGTLALAASAGASDWRLRGSLGGWAYGYQDASNIHHVWLVEQTNLSVYRTGTPWSLHASGGWTGDMRYDYNERSVEDDVVRFTRGYLRYGQLGSPVRAQLGRFFLLRGPAIGVLDGIDAEYHFGNGVNVAAFGGVWGPFTREFEFESPDDALAYGGEVGWTGRDVWVAKRFNAALSYANIQRNGENLRQRVGLRTYMTFAKNIKWTNVGHFRVEGTPLRRFVSRVRQDCDATGTRMLEVGIYTPETPDLSWFSDFEEMTYTRIRAAADRWVVQDKWGLGLSAAALMSGKTGYRVGPYLKFPFGRIGYRFYGGDQPAGDGFWASASYSPMDMVDVYAYGSMATYEWEAVDSETGDVMSLYGGVRVNEIFDTDLSLKLEYQHFQTPQLSQDRRMMAGLRWGFDTAGGHR